MRDKSRHPRSLPARLCQLLVLALPATVLAFLAWRVQSNVLGIAAAAFLPLLFLLKAPSAWRPPLSAAVILVFAAALSLAYFMTRHELDAAIFAARSLLFLAIVSLIICHDLYRTGAEPRRRARKWCSRLQSRNDWPPTLAEIPHLPEVLALRDAVAIEPGPVFELFRDVRPQVRAAAFAAFIGRSNWRFREAAALLEEARKTTEPGVRVIALEALGTIDDNAIVNGVAGFFQDPSPDVRAAAVQATLCDGGHRWGIVRDAVRNLLGDHRSRDTALPGSAGLLPVVAICDLTSWAGEPAPTGSRSVRTLIDHYSLVLQKTGDYDLITDLTNQVLDPATPTVLRVELAGLLRFLGLLTPELLDRLTNADQPGPVRLLAAEAMLTADPYHPDGLDVLRGLGRQPNREMALSIASILQNRLGFDMGLPKEGLTPNSKAAGDVAKKVMAWAVARTGDRRMATPTPEAAFAPRSGGVAPLVPITPHPTDAPMLQALAETVPPQPLPSRKGPW